MPWVIESARVDEMSVYRTRKDLTAVMDENYENAEAPKGTIPAASLVQVQEIELTENGVEIAWVNWKEEKATEVKSGWVSTKALVESGDNVPSTMKFEESRQPWITKAAESAWSHKVNIKKNLENARTAIFNVANGSLATARMQLEAAEGDESAYRPYVEKVVNVFRKTLDASKEIGELIEEIDKLKGVR